MKDLLKKKDKISFNWPLLQWENITVEQVKLWERLYPEVDVIHEIKYEMIRWLDKNKENKKAHKRAWRKFIVNWLRRENEKRRFQT